MTSSVCRLGNCHHLVCVMSATNLLIIYCDYSSYGLLRPYTLLFVAFTNLQMNLYLLLNGDTRELTVAGSAFFLLAAFLRPVPYLRLLMTMELCRLKIFLPIGICIYEYGKSSSSARIIQWFGKQLRRKNLSVYCLIINIFLYTLILTVLERDFHLLPLICCIYVFILLSSSDFIYNLSIVFDESQTIFLMKDHLRPPGDSVLWRWADAIADAALSE